MTRNEFIEDVNNFYDLRDFCWGNDCYECDNVFDEEGRDDYVNEHLVDWARDADNWEDLQEQLNDIATGYDFYRINDYGELEGLDDYDFESYKDDVLSWGDNHDIWDEDEEEEEEVEEDYSDVEEEPRYASSSENTPEPEASVEDGCSLNELFSSGISQLQTIEIEEEATAQEADEAFKQFVSVAV